MTEISADVAVIGSGPGGYVAAIKSAQLGLKTVLIEKDKLGGICLNYGCIPSKAMIYASDFLKKVDGASKMGINASNVSLDFSKMQEWKNGVVTKLTKGVETLCTGNKITIIKGTASFESSTVLNVTGEETTINFKHAIIASGSQPIEIENFSFTEDAIISSKQALDLESIPKNLVVVGGGYIGLELGTVYAKLGTAVNVVEMTSQLLPGTEKDTVQPVHRNLEKLGVVIHLNTIAKKYENGHVIIEHNNQESQLAADKVLVAVGRRPNTDKLGLENTSIKCDENGFITVDENLQTADSNIYAIGDVSVGPMLAHKASYQGKFVAELINGDKKAFEHAVVPAVIFTDPEIATVGMSEQNAATKSIPIKIGKFPFLASSRAMTKGNISGFVKIIADAKTEKVLGVEIVGQDASDLISEASLAIKMGTTLEDLSRTIHPHPTLSESLMEAADAAMGKAIHILNPKI